ncbi:hypothetical protein BsWGS_23025 [Bradybaena similaris]
MDFSFNVDELIKDEITCVDNSLEICRSGSSAIPREGFLQLQKKLFEVVDKMGEASAKAQGLNNPITTGAKLKASDHRLYILKDSSGNSGKGCIVGILKVGRKNLFLYDKSKVQHEVQPLCVLDFYVHESRQRMGCGRKLFDSMLRRESVPVQHFAINRPSPKLLSFLAKHYNMKVSIPQVYNFVIFDGFFNNREGNNQSRKSIENSHSDKNTWSSLQNVNSGRRNYNSQNYDDETARNALSNWLSPNSCRQNERHMGAGQMMYSRHGSSAGVRGPERPSSTRNKYRPEPAPVISDVYRNHTNEYGSSNAAYNASTCTGQKYGDHGMMPPTQLKQPSDSNPPVLPRDGPPGNYKDMLNLHQRYQQRNGHLTLPAGTMATSVPDSTSSQSAHVTSDGQGNSPNYNQPASNTSWTVMSVLRDQKLNTLVHPGDSNNHRWW